MEFPIIPPHIRLKRTKLSKKAQERHDDIKNKLFQSNMWWNDWKFQLHWNKFEWVDTKSNPKRVKTFSVSSKTLYISKNDRTAHFVGRSQLKELDIDGFYKRKQMNEEMESEMTKMDLISDHLEDSEDKCADEAVPIYIRKERTTKAHKETMSQYIKNIDIYETRKKLI